MPTMRPSDRFVALSDQERAILRAWHDHDGHAEVAHSLCLALSTVKNALGGIHRKLKVRSTAAAIVKAHRLGLVPIETKGGTMWQKPPGS